jgi:hypothetical protein
MRGTVRRLLLCLSEYFGPQLWRQFLGRLSGMKRGQAHQSFFAVAPLPQRDGRCRGIQFFLDLVVAGTFVQHQDDSHSQGDAGRKITPSQMRLQFAPLSGRQNNAGSQRHNHMTLPDLVKGTYRQPTSWCARCTSNWAEGSGV